MNIFSPFTQQVGANLLINGNFDIWQRGISDSTVTDLTKAFLDADRWSKNIVNAGAGFNNMTTQRYNVSTQSLNIPQSNYIWNWLCGGANSCNATSHYWIEQRIENGTFRYGGKALVLSFWMATAAMAQPIGIAMRQNYGTGGSAEEVIIGKIVSAPPAGGFVKQTVTFQLNTVYGKTVNADNYLALMIGILWGTTPGATYYGATTAQNASNAAGVSLSQMKLELGSIATPFNALSAGDELAACSRYFRKFADGTAAYASIASGQTTSATSGSCVVALNPPMYKVPTGTQKGNLGAWGTNGTVVAVSAISIIAADSTARSVLLTLTVASGFNVGGATILTANNDVTGDFWLDAEV